MLHLILLVLCWNFASTPFKAVEGDSQSDYLLSLGASVMIGTLIWAGLEGVYYLAITYVF